MAAASAQAPSKDASLTRRTGISTRRKEEHGRLVPDTGDRPLKFSRVKIPGSFVGADGLSLVGNEQLVIVANQTPAAKSEAAFLLKSTEDWVSAQLFESQPLCDYPTTCAALGDELFALSSRLDEWLGATESARPGLLKHGRRAEIRRIGSIDP
jgi:hypothetical protein